MAKDTDWRGIERDYRSGALSIREIAKKYGINEKTIRNRRDAEEWKQERAETPQDIRSTENGEVVESNNFDTSRTDEKSADHPQNSAPVLRTQWEEFARNIASGMPPKDAAICAGYSPTRAEAQSSVLFKRPEIKQRIRELRAETALLVSFDARDLADLSYNAAKAAKAAGKFGQVAPNVKNAAQLTGIEMGNKTEVNVDLAGLSYGKVCIVTPANCPTDIWASYMEKLREGKTIAQS